MSCVTAVRIEVRNTDHYVFVVLLYTIVYPFTKAILRVGEPCGYMWTKDNIVRLFSVPGTRHKFSKFRGSRIF